MIRKLFVSTLNTCGKTPLLALFCALLFLLLSHPLQAAITNLSLTTPAVTSPQPAGTTIPLYASCSYDGEGDVEYMFRAIAGSTTYYQSGYSTNTQVNWTPSATGSYSLRVDVREVGTTTNYFTTVTFLITSIANISLSTPGFPSPQNPGEITLQAGVTYNGNGTLEYKFSSSLGTAGLITIQDFTTASSCSWNPSATGRYKLYLYVREQGCVSGYERLVEISSYVITSIDSITLSASPDAPMPCGSEITLAADVSYSGLGTLEYKFQYRVGDVYTTISDYTTSSTCVWNSPTTSGNYLLYVFVREVGCPSVYEVASMVYNMVSPLSGLTLTTPTTAFPQPTGNQILLRATPTLSAAATIEYQFKTYIGGAYQTIRNFATDPDFIWTPTTAGTYNLYVYARQVGSFSPYEKYAYITSRSIIAATPPTVSLTAPTNGAVILTTEFPVSITATASDEVSISKVEFWCNGNLMATGDTTAPYSFNWSSATPGSYNLIAKAYDNYGSSMLSAQVTVVVVNSLPVVAFFTPDEDAEFTQGDTIIIGANATTTEDNTIAKVDFYQGNSLTNPIGTATMGYGDDGDEFFIIWVPVVAGPYTLVAKATDAYGVSKETTRDVYVHEFAVGLSQSVITDEDTDVGITLEVTDIIVNGPLTFSIATQPTHGTLSGTGADLVYTPDANYNGNDSFSFTVEFGLLINVPAMVYITVSPVNDIPSATSLIVSTDEEIAATVTLYGTDIEQSNNLTYILVTSPTHGKLTGTVPNLVYTPRTQYHGTDIFKYRITDGELSSQIATVTITVNPVDDAPIANNSAITVYCNQPTNCTLGASDPDDDPLSYTYTNPEHGTLQGTAPDLIYTPAQDFIGDDSFTFAVSDSISSSTATITIKVVNFSLNSENLANGWGSVVSGDGRYVAFLSDADDLVEDDTNLATDVYIKDRQGTTQRVSVATDGTEADGDSYGVTISNNGRYIAFVSAATNLVANDTNNLPDIFVRDRQTGETKCVSIGMSGEQANGKSWGISISNDGRYIAFTSDATNLVTGYDNKYADIFLFDQTTATTQCISGGGGDGPSWGAAINADGSIVTFISDASNLSSNDINASPDIFVYEFPNGIIERIGEPESNTQNGCATSINGDGRFVVFSSDADNLTYLDTNEHRDIFVYDREYDVMRRVCEGNGSLLIQADGDCWNPAISDDGCFIAFTSSAESFAAGGNGIAAAYRYDFLTEKVILLQTANNAIDLLSWGGDLDADGMTAVSTSTTQASVIQETSGSNINVTDITQY